MDVAARHNVLRYFTSLTSGRLFYYSDYTIVVLLYGFEVLLFYNCSGNVSSFARSHFLFFPRLSIDKFY